MSMPIFTVLRACSAAPRVRCEVLGWPWVCVTWVCRAVCEAGPGGRPVARPESLKSIAGASIMLHASRAWAWCVSGSRGERGTFTTRMIRSRWSARPARPFGKFES
eukprot:2970020-Prymnesium_polylepis.1